MEMTQRSVTYRYYKYYVLIAALIACLYYTITGQFTDHNFIHLCIVL